MADLLASEVVGSWAMPTPATANEEKRDYTNEAICRMSGERVAYVAS